MGDPRKPRKQYERPRRLWDKQRIENDSKLVEEYGLKNMRELWKSQSWIRIKRQNARKLLALPIEEKEGKEKELIGSLQKVGILRDNATLDDVLSLTVKDALERRIQTMVWRKGLANTAKQARQFIVHGHISLNGRKADRPSQVVPKIMEGSINWNKNPMQLSAPEQTKKEAFEEIKDALNEATDSPEGETKS